MKIGILTLRLFKNYGGILQNYALSRFLQKNGYDVETINSLVISIEWGKKIFCLA